MIDTGRLSAFLLDRQQSAGQMRALVSGELYEAVMETNTDYAVGLIVDEAWRRGYLTNDVWAWPQSTAAITWRWDNGDWTELEVPTVEAWQWWQDAAGLRASTP